VGKTRKAGGLQEKSRGEGGGKGRKHEGSRRTKKNNINESWEIAGNYNEGMNSEVYSDQYNGG